MKHTAIGLIASNDGTAADFAGGRGAWSTAACEFRTAQPQRVPIDINHGGHQIGQIVHLERGPGGIVAVGELDISEPALHVRVRDETVALREPTFFSAQVDGTLDGRDLVLVGVAVCHKTARLAATPLQWLEGDLAHRSTWHVDWRRRGLIDRAAETWHRRFRGGPLIVHGHNAHQLTRFADGGHLDTATGEPVPAHHHDTPDGPLWIRPSRITAVNGQPVRSR